MYFGRLWSVLVGTELSGTFYRPPDNNDVQRGRGRVGRPQRRLEPGDGPLAEFAVGLRDLRDTTGPMTYRRLAARAHYSATTLADAAGGERLPSLAVTLAYVEACGGDRAEWEARWRTVSALLNAASAEQNAVSAESDDGSDGGTDGGTDDRTGDRTDDEADGRAAVAPGAGSGAGSGAADSAASGAGSGVTSGPGAHATSGARNHGTHTADDSPVPAPLWRRAASPLTLAALAVTVSVVVGLATWSTGPRSGSAGSPPGPAPRDDVSASAPADRTSKPDAGHAGHTPEPSAAHRYFADSDPVNRRNSRRLSPDSARLARSLLDYGGIQVAAGSAGMPVYRATDRTPTHRVAARDRSRGPNPFSGIDFPWDPSWTEPSGRGGWSIVVTPGGRSLECWRTVVRSGGVPSCEWGGVSDTGGSSVASWGTPTGGGLSRLAGTITREDWESGRIRHALTFSLPFNGPRHVYPAVQSDGRGPDEWAEGQYIWLDPSYDIDADRSLRPYERMVAHALQDYGAFDVGYAATIDFTSERGVAPPGSDGESHLSLRNVKFAEYLRVGTVRPE